MILSKDAGRQWISSGHLSGFHGALRQQPSLPGSSGEPSFSLKVASMDPNPCVHMNGIYREFHDSKQQIPYGQDIIQDIIYQLFHCNKSGFHDTVQQTNPVINMRFFQHNSFQQKDRLSIIFLVGGTFPQPKNMLVKLGIISPNFGGMQRSTKTSKAPIDCFFEMFDPQSTLQMGTPRGRYSHLAQISILQIDW